MKNHYGIWLEYLFWTFNIVFSNISSWRTTENGMWILFPWLPGWVSHIFSCIILSAYFILAYLHLDASFSSNAHIFLHTKMFYVVNQRSGWEISSHFIRKLEKHLLYEEMSNYYQLHSKCCTQLLWVFWIHLNLLPEFPLPYAAKQLECVDLCVAHYKL